MRSGQRVDDGQANQQAWPSGVPAWYLGLSERWPGGGAPAPDEQLGPNRFSVGPAFCWFPGELCDDLNASGWEFYGPGEEMLRPTLGNVALADASPSELLSIAARRLNEPEKDLRLEVMQEDELRLNDGPWLRLPMLRVIVNPLQIPQDEAQPARR